jgi:hypothetical protein
MASLDRIKLRQDLRYEDGWLFWVNPPRGCKEGQCLGGYVGNTSGHLAGMYSRKKYMLHQLVWAWHYDFDPPHINHINGDPADNRIENLEASDASHNGLHARNILRERGLPPGVHRNREKFVGRCRRNNQRYNTKTVDTPEEAHALIIQLRKDLGFTS